MRIECGHVNGAVQRKTQDVDGWHANLKQLLVQGGCLESIVVKEGDGNYTALASHSESVHALGFDKFYKHRAFMKVLNKVPGGANQQDILQDAHYSNHTYNLQRCMSAVTDF